MQKSGYKKTKIGFIPEDWEVKPLESFAETNPRKPKINDESWVSFVTMSSVSEDGKIISHETKPFYEVKNGYTYFENNDIIIAKITPCFENKKGALVRGLPYKIGFGSTEFHVIRLQNGIDKAFVFYHTRAHRFRMSGEKNMTGSAGQKRVPLQFLKKYLIPLPPLPEQQKIAQILSTWDRGIELTQKLIKKSELLKKGLMQQLLTGKVRVICPETGKPFEGEWERKKIKEIATEVKLINKNHEITLVLSCTKYDGLVESLKYFGRQVYSKNLTKYKVVPKDRFAYATNHIEEGSIGFQSNHKFGLVSPMYTVFKTNSLVFNPYLYMVLKSPRLIYEYQSRSIGSVNRRGGLRWHEFSRIPISLPSLKEQKSIASQLNKINLQIEYLNKYLDCLKTQKKGLMQQLLTGKKRVKTVGIHNQTN